MNIKHKRTKIIGKVLRFTYNEPGIKSKYFEVELPDTSKCFCKGDVILGKTITIGSYLLLQGEWKVNPNLKYKALGEQFYFESYEIITKEIFDAVTRNKPIDASIKEEMVEGRILKFNLYKDKEPYRIFLLKSSDNREFYCQGYELQGKELHEELIVRLSGKWKLNPIRPAFGQQFYFSFYEIIDQSKPQKIILRKGNDALNSRKFKVDQNIGFPILMNEIGQKNINYEFHYPQYGTIADHVSIQLHKRIIDSSVAEKEFYFLTAFLDRKVKNEKIELFRKHNQNFKQYLIKCWSEAEAALKAAIDDISRTIKDSNQIVCSAECA
ncbi:MAG: hypothetical protein ABSB79_15940 [Syntrophales bacterium]|jgi:hypothetical protein